MLLGDSTVAERQATVEAMLNVLPPEERNATLAKFGGGGGGGGGGSGAEVDEADEEEAAGPRSGGAFAGLPRRQGKKASLGQRRAARGKSGYEAAAERAESGGKQGKEPSRGSVPPPVGTPNDEEDEAPPPEVNQHQLGGGASLAEMLRRKVSDFPAASPCSRPALPSPDVLRSPPISPRFLRSTTRSS